MFSFSLAFSLAFTLTLDSILVVVEGVVSSFEVVLVAPPVVFGISSDVFAGAVAVVGAVASVEDSSTKGSNGTAACDSLRPTLPFSVVSVLRDVASSSISF